MTHSAIVQRILIADDEEKIRNILSAILTDQGYDVFTAKDGVEAIELSKKHRPHLFIADLQMPRVDGLEAIARIKELFPQTVALILTAHGTVQSAVQAMKEGAFDYLTKPFDNDQLVFVVKRALEFSRMSEEIDELRGQLRGEHGVQAIVGRAPVVERLRSIILQVATNDATVLIEGESGTGKELAARAIHYESKRRDSPLVTVDCSALPSSLVEREFFGHEAGAFTDARESRPGKFEEANGGTVFLDEIGELPLEAQTRLLRFLQEKEITRIGATKPIYVDVRVIAATNKDLDALVKSGEFREDLFYRLNVLKLTVPPLREHLEDIPTYAGHFLQKHRASFGKKVSEFSADALAVLALHPWKGNIRELENAIQRALLSASADTIERSDLAFLSGNEQGSTGDRSLTDGLESYIRSVAEEHERRLILDTLRATNWNRTEAAERLKISRKTLFNKMLQYGLDADKG